MRKRGLVILLAGLMSVTLIGCGGPKQAEQEKNEEDNQKQEIAADVSEVEGTINLWTDQAQSDIDFQVESFNKYVPGVKVNVTVLPSSEYGKKIQNALRSGKNVPDVMSFEIGDFGNYKDSDYLENLSQDQYGAEEVSKDMFPYVDTLSRDKNGQLKGLSFQATPGGFWYRKDLAREYLGTDDPDELNEMLSDWDKIIEVGKQVYEKSGGEVALMDGVGSLGTMYSYIKGEPWVDENNQLISDEFLMDYFTRVESLVKNNTTAKLDKWTAGWTAGMFAKKVFIMEADPSWGLKYSIKPGIPEDQMDEAEDTWGLIKAPVDYYSGGTWYAMYSQSENKDAAWAWIKTISSNIDFLVDDLAGVQGDFPGYIPAAEKCLETGHTDPITGDQQYFEFFYDIAMNVEPDPLTKYDSQAGVSRVAQTKLIVEGKITPEEAVEGFKKEMKNAYPEIEAE